VALDTNWLLAGGRSSNVKSRVGVDGTYLEAMVVPPSGVFDEFGAESDPQPLAGGRGTAWRAGGLVLKPLDMSASALEWQADVFASVRPIGFRVAAPLRSRAGALVVEGWTAWPALEGLQAPRWDEVIAVGRRLHDALAGVERPARALDERTDIWARADRIAWAEAPAGELAAVPEVAQLLAARGPVNAPNQLVHGDLTGNILFADGLTPAVIDFSPYWRPTGSASLLSLPMRCCGMALRSIGSSAFSTPLRDLSCSPERCSCACWPMKTRGHMRTSLGRTSSPWPTDPVSG